MTDKINKIQTEIKGLKKGQEQLRIEIGGNISMVISRTPVTMESISSFEDGFWYFGVFRKK